MGVPEFVVQFRGELAALSAALIWAGASVIYQGVGRQLPPLILNLTKGWIAIVLLLLTLLLRGTSMPEVGQTGVLLLLLSGVIGIGFGDTAYFHALNCIGPRRTLLLETLSPSLAAFLALVFLQEHLLIAAWFGIGLTLAGVIWVTLERAPTAIQHAQFRPVQGVLFGLLAALGQAIGAVLSRAALVGTEIDPLWSTLLRLLGGTLVLLVWSVLRHQSSQLLKPLQSLRLLSIVAGTAFASTYLGIWLQQISLKYAATGVAQALSTTSPLFVLPISLYLGEKVTVRAFVGVLIALVGVWLLFR